MIKENLDGKKSRDNVLCECDAHFCNKTFYRQKKSLIYNEKKRYEHQFCSNKCQGEWKKEEKRLKVLADGGKVCSLCKKFKEIKYYNKSASKSDGLNNGCRDCMNDLARNNWNNPQKREHYMRNHNKRRRSYIKRNCEYVWNFLQENPCVDCGEDNIVMLEFDHIYDKQANISEMTNWGAALKTLKEEMSKCEVRCANCHRLKTAKDFNWGILEYQKNYKKKN